MNFPPNLFAGRRYAVVGLGRNGLPAAHALLAMGADIVAWDDSRRDATGLRIERPRFPGFDALLLSPGIPATHPIAREAAASAVPILCDAEMLYRAVRAAGSSARFVGITGTNGKSTTTALVAHLLREAGTSVAVGGNLGPAALGLPLLPRDAVYVLEMSSYMLERIDTLRFDAAAMLNLSPDHLDRHGDMAGYAAAKARIFARQQPGDLAVVGADDGFSCAMAATLPAATAISAGDDLPPLPATLSGAHNQQNAAAALAIARWLRPDHADWSRALASFPGLAHRLERVAKIGGVTFVNDSKATNSDAAATALACFDRVAWIAGGIAKAGGIDGMAHQDRIAHALLIGRDAPVLARTLAANGISHEIVGTLERAVPAARAHAATVLLSPACASFDQFTDFEARGERFRELVLALEAR